jgi:hypothetical protein
VGDGRGHGRNTGGVRVGSARVPPARSGARRAYRARDGACTCRPARGLGTLHGAAGGVELFFSLRGSAEEIESRLDWRYTRGEGSALEQLLGARLMLAALRGELVELVQPKDDHVLMSGIVDAPDDAAEWREELETREAFLSYVAELEAWLGTHLHPPAQPTSSDAGVLSSIIPLIRRPEAPITWQRVELAPGASRPSDDGPLQFALLQPLHARLSLA